MAQIPLQPTPQCDPDAAVGASLATRWKAWLADFDTIFIASSITEPKRQRHSSCIISRSSISEIFKQLHDTYDNDDFDTAKTKLTQF